MKKIYSILALAATMTCTSCNDWLDVRPETEKKSKELFTSYKGFRDALTGCYMSMADRNIYGERLTISNIESLANLWYLSDETTRLEDAELAKHNYNSDHAKDAVKVFYGGLFNTIAQANMIIKNADENSFAFENEYQKSIIQGEAYAMRAYCQLDVLRLFGQLPGNASISVELPYSETTGIDEIPPYYGFAAYVTKLESDINHALALLKDHDPLFQYTFEQLNDNKTELDDDYLRYRQSRLNYWAVKALQARMYLYLGRKEQAHQVAMEIIQAKGVEGDALITLSGEADFKKSYFSLPSECLFYISKFDIRDYTNALLIGGTETVLSESHLVISFDMLTQMYADQNTASHNRYTSWWNKTVKDKYGQAYAALKKYFFKEDADNLLLKRQIIPMLRLSEVYLIAIETTNDLAEANRLYAEYMASHNVLMTADKFTKPDDVLQDIIGEYRREFFAEGQMFYTYKRLGAVDMLWHEADVEMQEYILPLPESEYNPNK